MKSIPMSRFVSCTVSTDHLRDLGSVTTFSRLVESVLLASGNTSCKKFEILEWAVTDHFKEKPDEFYLSLLPFMASEASRPISAEKLKIVQPGSQVTFTKRECLTLLSASFLFCFPRRTSHNCVSAECPSMPSINLDELFATSAPNPEPRYAKTRMLLHYFQESKRRVDAMDARLNGSFVIEVSKLQRESFACLLQRPLQPVKIQPLQESIDDAKDMIRIDFANAFVGGGAIAYGCVQEEIMFSICPELIVSRLVVEQMEEDVACAFVGAEQFTKPLGYAFGLRYGGPHQEESTVTASTSYIVAIDAIMVMRPDSQYAPEMIDRELVKAAAGISCKCLPTAMADVATGNWGCGAFGGDPQMKSLIQWVAFSAYEKVMSYFPFDNELVLRQFPHVVDLLRAKNVTCKELYEALKEYRAKRGPREGTYAYILRTFR